MKTVVYKTVQGHDIHADIYAADSDGPAILFVHAGGQISGNRKLISTSQVETYNRLGYSVVSIDYRLAPQTKLASVVTDVEDAYAWMRGEGSAQFGFDPDKIVVMGGSAGGYHTLLAGSRLQPSPRAVVAFYGYCDLTSPWTSTPTPFEGVPPVSEDVARAGIGHDVVSEGSIEFDSPGGDFFFFVRQQGIWVDEVTGHNPSTDPDWFPPYCPIQHVTPSYPPALLLHGQADRSVPFEQSVMMAERLAACGVQHDLITNPQWDHIFDIMAPDDPAVRDAVGKVADFLEDQF